MKQQNSMRVIYALLTVWLIAVTALTLTACGQQNEFTPPASDETTIGALCALVEAPTMKIHYQDEALTCSATMTPSVHTYVLGAEIAPGTRPCEQEQLCTITMADADGEVQMAFFTTGTGSPAADDAALEAARALTDLTLTAYPADEDGTVDLAPEKAQTLPVANGRFTMLVGCYYYELTMPQVGGQLTYGFIGYRIDSEKYHVTYRMLTPCLEEAISEDPDVYLKKIPRITVFRPYGHTGWNPYSLYACGVGSWTYTNYAGTEVTLLWDHGDPLAESYMATIESTQLSFTFEIEYESGARGVEGICYTRYAHDGTPLDSEVEILNNKIDLLENSYYVFTVSYEGGSVQYVLKTGSADFTAHPKDDPTMPALTAAILRQSYQKYIMPYSSPVTVDDIWIERYLGTFGGCQAIFIGGPFEYEQTPRTLDVGVYRLRFESEQELYLCYKTRLYTVEEAYKAKLITDRDVYDLGVALNGEAFLQEYPIPPVEDTGD